MEESIMIGDNLNADIFGAKNAGMDTVFVNHINAESICRTHLHHSSPERTGIYFIIFQTAEFYILAYITVLDKRKYR